MEVGKRKFKKFYLIVFFLLIIILSFYFFKNHYEKNKAISLQPVTINLLTSVHPNLSWSFEPLKPKLLIKPGEVTTVEYIVENFGNKKKYWYCNISIFSKRIWKIYKQN